jgi:hypothetical protein
VRRPTNRRYVRLKTNLDPPYSWRSIVLGPADVQGLEALRSAVRVSLKRELGLGTKTLGGLSRVMPSGQLTRVETDAAVNEAVSEGAALQVELIENAVSE